VTDTAEGGGAHAKPAATVVFAFIVTVQDPVPKQPPDHPVNVAPDTGVAVRVNCVPGATEAEQVEPQLIPAGDEDTVPSHAPDLITLNVYAAVGVTDI
jgi:hypothetical protein